MKNFKEVWKKCFWEHKSMGLDFSLDKQNYDRIETLKEITCILWERQGELEEKIKELKEGL